VKLILEFPEELVSTIIIVFGLLGGLHAISGIFSMLASFLKVRLAVLEEEKKK